MIETNQWFLPLYAGAWFAFLWLISSYIYLFPLVIIALIVITQIQQNKSKRIDRQKNNGAINELH